MKPSFIFEPLDKWDSFMELTGFGEKRDWGDRKRGLFQTYKWRCQVGYMTYKSGKGQSDINLGVTDIQMIFKRMKWAEITQGDRVEMEKRRGQKTEI